MNSNISTVTSPFARGFKRTGIGYALLLALILAPNVVRWGMSLQYSLSSSDGNLFATLFATLFGLFVNLFALLAVIGLWRWSPRILASLLGIFALGAAVDIVHILDYGEHIGPGGLAVIMDTHAAEAHEFLTMVSQAVLPVAGVYGAGLVVAIWLVGSQSRRPSARLQRWSLVLLMVAVVGATAKRSPTFSYPLSMMRAGLEYALQRRELAMLQAHAGEIHFGVQYRGDPHAVYVLVIGESLRRDHMSLYGYERTTTPYLEQTPGWLAFDDVISGATQTRNSLKMILSPANPKDLGAFYRQGNLVQLAREAGFEVIWLSNQGQFGKHDTEVTKIATDANARYFTNTDWNTSSLDEKLLPLFTRALEDRPRPLLIIVHLLGSHAAYERRYSDAHAVFSQSDGKMTQVDHYDNSVHYTDWILHELLSRYRAVASSGCLVFTSDHAEYLADSEPRYGHGFPVPRRQELEVPLLVYCTPEWKAAYPQVWQAMQDNLPLAMSNVDLFYGMAQLMDMNYTEEIRACSPFSSSYHPPKERLVLTPDGHVVIYESLKNGPSRMKEIVSVPSNPNWSRTTGSTSPMNRNASSSLCSPRA